MSTAPHETTPGFVAIPLGKGCLLLLTATEYQRALNQGKAYRRRLALAERSSIAPRRERET